MADEPTILDRLLGIGRDYVLPVVSGAGSLLDTYSGAGSVRDLIAGENPFDQLFDPFNDEKRVSGRQMLEKRGWADENLEDVPTLKYLLSTLAGYNALAHSDLETDN